MLLWVGCGGAGRCLRCAGRTLPHGAVAAVHSLRSPGVHVLPPCICIVSTTPAWSAGALEPLPDVIPDEWYYRRPDHAAAAAALQPLHIHSAAAPAPSTEASAPPHLPDSPQGTTAGAYAAALDSAESSATAQAPESAACGPPCAHSPLAADLTSHDKLPPGGGASSPRPPALPADAQRSPAAVWDTWVRANEADMAWLAGASPAQAGTGAAHAHLSQLHPVRARHSAGCVLHGSVDTTCMRHMHA